MFYDLTKDGTLSPGELFKYRLKKSVVIPSRGGQKEFEPDESWLQVKSIRAAIQEKTAAISEPKVEKLKSLVEGEWNEELRLVDLKKSGKFWMHMGFTDNRRNWLYPEEAIFLIETNTLEVYHHGLPMSVQEAFNTMLDKDVSIEEYQVFAHLRRLGYVVLRREEGKVLTDYERQINLEQPSKKKGKKDISNKGSSADPQASTSRDETRMAKSSGSSRVENNDDQYGTTSTLSRPDNDNDDKEKSDAMDEETVKEPTLHAANDLQESQGKLNQKRLLTHDDDESSSQALKKQRTDATYDETDEKQGELSSNSQKTSRLINVDLEWSSCFSQGTKVDKSSVCLKQTMLDSSQWECFPNIANKQALLLLQIPEKTFFPDLVEIEKDSDLLRFDISSYRQMFPSTPQNMQEQHENAKEDRVRNLKFSFSEWNQKKMKVEASSWKDFKQKTAEKVSSLSNTTPMEDSWNGNITPLVHPSDATSYGHVLQKLRIIQSASSDSLIKCSKLESTQVKISYDVHLPDQRFRKSMPGIPNHRVCVKRSSEEPPSLAQLMGVWKKYKDDVPVHWAVVDAGEIAFYSFDPSSAIETIIQ